MNYRYRICPDTTQQEILSEWMETCRIAYNYALREIKDWCNSRKCLVDRCSLTQEYIIPADAPFPREVNQLNALPKAKKVFPRLGEVPSQVLQQTIKQLHKAWENFQKRGFGFPRFKKYGQIKSLLFPQFKESPVIPPSPLIKGGAGGGILLPKIGLIPINLHRPIPDGFVVKQVRILKKADIWYVSIAIQSDVNVPEPMPQGHPIGVDVGLEKFLATSDGVFVKPPKFFRKMQSKLKLLQRRLSRKQKRSKNYEKQRLKVSKIHHKIDNTRKDFHFKQAHALCESADMIFMEDLDFTIMAKGFLGKHMLDGGFGQFRSIVKYVCWKLGKFFGEVNSRGTSQECPECGAIAKKDLKIRVHHCPECGYTTDRDVASSQVIRNRGIALINTVGHTGMETVCPGELAGIAKSSQVPKALKGITRKSKK